ncbi:transposon Tf2-6 polyprotein [Trichonephila inaurata madagascariensis]|uniref:Transposon Tf2-6 polyprotein n=1 Tax=Trichonephila inaurata madagascariensis TaxID=2747483 RepID=A0A8X6WXR2_9ARAC|nr:transposon Tf2-6 polyprotein [Trichonephila inaurata madagascariensis]
MGKKDLVTRIARWAMLLEKFDYEIIHRPGQRIKHVDALSRYPVMVMSDTLTLRLKNAQSEDEGIATLKALLVAKTKEVVKKEFFIPNLNKLAQQVIANCVPCILTSRKSGKREGFQHRISKDETPLHTFHVDFISLLESTNKNYQHILTKFLVAKIVMGMNVGAAFERDMANGKASEENYRYIKFILEEAQCTHILSSGNLN